MKIQALVFMLGATLAAHNPVFAMDDQEHSENGKKAEASKQRYRADFPCFDFSSAETLNYSLNKQPLTRFVRDSKNNVYELSSLNGHPQKIINYLQTPIDENMFPPLTTRFLMDKELIDTPQEIRLIYMGGTYSYNRGTQEVTLQQQEFFFKKIDKSLYGDLFTD